MVRKDPILDRVFYLTLDRVQTLTVKIKNKLFLSYIL